MTFKRYVEDTWLPNHQIEPSTRQSYTYSINKHVVPWFGPMRMVDILPEHVREWVTDLKTKGVTPVTIKYNKVLLSAIFTTALNDQVTFLHPCKGVKTPTVTRKPLAIITPEQFDKLYRSLPDAVARQLVETDIETGARWGELTELRPKDLDPSTRILTVARAVVEVNPKFHPQGERFWVKEYPKDGEYRRVKLSAQMTAKITAHIKAEGLGPDDLLFAMHDQDDKRPVLRVAPDPDTLGWTEPNDKRAQLPARHPYRLRRRQVPLSALQRRLRDLPREATCPGQGRASGSRPETRHRRPHPRGLVPSAGLETGGQGGWPWVRRSPDSRPASRARLVAACRRR